MGAEHSSARPERLLLMCNDDQDVLPATGTSGNMHLEQLRSCNWSIVAVTTPANLFHVLRRQVAMPFRRPLVILYPKSLLRLHEARSEFDEMTEKTEFKRVIGDKNDPQGVKKVVFCVGKVYYDFAKARADKHLEKEIAVVRIEQVSGFPFSVFI